ncbi:MAG: hypothetical protein R6V05_01620 [Candidatus Brocadiia bacterium]
MSANLRPWRRVAVLLLALALPAAGCSVFRRPPPGPPLPRRQVLEILRDRSERFHTLVDTRIGLRMAVTDSIGRQEGPKLGGHVAFDRDLPGLWVSAEKLGRQIFSLKAVGWTFALILPETREVVTGGPVAYEKLPHLIRPAEVRRILAGPERLGLSWPAAEMTVEPEVYRFRVDLAGSPYMEVAVDRRQVAITLIRRYDVLGRTVTEVHMGDYEEADGLLFPHRLAIHRPLHGTEAELRLGRPRLNKPIPAEAFQPPELPGWRRVDLDRQPLEEVEAFRAE